MSFVCRVVWKEGGGGRMRGLGWKSRLQREKYILMLLCEDWNEADNPVKDTF